MMPEAGTVNPEAETKEQPKVAGQTNPTKYCPFMIAGVIANGFTDTGYVSCECREGNCGVWDISLDICGFRSIPDMLHGLRIESININDALRDLNSTMSIIAKRMK